MKPNVLHTCVLNKYRRPVGRRCVGGGVTHALSAAHSADWPPGGPSARPAPHLAAPLAGQGLPVSCAHSTQSVRGCLDRIYSVSLNYMRVRHSGLGNGFVEGRGQTQRGLPLLSSTTIPGPGEELQAKSVGSAGTTLSSSPNFAIWLMGDFGPTYPP